VREEVRRHTQRQREGKEDRENNHERIHRREAEIKGGRGINQQQRGYPTNTRGEERKTTNIKHPPGGYVGEGKRIYQARGEERRKKQRC